MSDSPSAFITWLIRGLPAWRGLLGVALDRFEGPALRGGRGLVLLLERWCEEHGSIDQGAYDCLVYEVGRLRPLLGLVDDEHIAEARDYAVRLERLCEQLSGRIRQ